MKKILYTAILTLIVLTMGACNNTNNISKSKSDNTLSEAKLTDREKDILSTTTDQSFVFEYHMADSTYKEVSVWVEKYESGKRVEDKKIHVTAGLKNNGTIIFATSTPTSHQNESMFSVSINSKGDTTTGSNLETITKEGSEQSKSLKNSEINTESVMSVWGSNEAENILISDKMVLASVGYSYGEGSMRTLSQDFYSDMDHHINEIKDFDVVYLLRSEFTK
ncbi:hypothetical protein NGI46_06290 [Peribacillus butanolivorans]|uniref:hypothetical protein n=1 Tax=Peribacillus butanolivorans TaxID=421767 RepID=UPI00207C45A6|nr:hypothetical protein [Peribacillus butanolivorans]MCO0597073.1 hypothetical protein [Peribacillus butanolivorans]